MASRTAASTALNSLNAKASTTFASNKDLMGEVFLYFRDDDDPSDVRDVEEQKKARQALYNCAKSSRALLAPALDSLWFSLDSLLPILRLIPGYDPSTSIIRLVENPNWSIFDQYSKRVRIFTLGGRVRVDLPLISIIQLASRRSCLLPKLGALRYVSPSVDPSYILLLFSPTLKHVHFRHPIRQYFEGYSHSPSVPQVFTRLIKTNQVEKLTLDLVEHLGFRPHSSVLPPSLFNCHSLRTLHITSLIGSSDLTELMALPNLLDLNVALPHTIHGQISSPSLERLTLTMHFAKLCSVLQRFSVPKLRHISLNHSRQLLTDLINEGGADVQSVITTVASLSTVISTVGLQIRQTVPQTSPIQNDQVQTRQLLSPLASSTHLENLDLSGFLYLPFTNDDVSRWTIRLPNIKSLRLPEVNNITPRRPTFLSLSILAKHCPRLETLRISLDTSGIAEERPDHVPMDHRLRDLDVASSQILPEHAWVFARHVDRLFPRLDRLGCSAVGDTMWTPVKQAIWCCQSVREDQIRRVNMSAR